RATPRGLALVLGLVAGCADDLSGGTGKPTGQATATAAVTGEPEATASTETSGGATALTAATARGGTADAGLCMRLGEAEGAAAVAAAIAAEVASDARISAYFLNAGFDGQRFRTCLGDQVATM